MQVFSFRSRLTKAHRIPVALLSGLMMVAACGGSPEGVDDPSDEQQTAAPSEASPNEEAVGAMANTSCNPWLGECWSYVMVRTYVSGARGIMVRVEQNQQPYTQTRCVPDTVGTWAGSGMTVGHEGKVTLWPVWNCTDKIRIPNTPSKTFGPLTVNTTGGNVWFTY